MGIFDAFFNSDGLAKQQEKRPAHEVRYERQTQLQNELAESPSLMSWYWGQEADEDILRLSSKEYARTYNAAAARPITKSYGSAYNDRCLKEKETETALIKKYLQEQRGW